MATPFFSSATGDPVNLTRLLAFQATEGVPVEESGMVPFKSFGGNISLNPSTVEAQRLNLLPMRKRKMASKMNYSGNVLAMGDADPGNHGQLMLWLGLLKGYTLATASGHTRWRISHQRAIESGGVAVNRKLCLTSDSDKGIPIRFKDVIVESASLSLSPSANAALEFGIRPGKFDHWGLPVVTGTGVVQPYLEHSTSSENWAADATDGDVYIKIISDSATQVVYQAKVASAGTYSSDQTATKGTWRYVYTGTSSTVPLGNHGQQVRIYFPTGANNSFVDNDVWVFPKRATLTVVDGDYPTPRPLSEIQFRFFIDGEETAVTDGVTLNIGGRSAETLYGVGGEQPSGTDVKGQQTATVTIDTRLIDLTFQKKLLTRGTASLVIQGRNDVIVGSSTAYYSYFLVMPELVLEGDSHDTEAGGTNYNQQITMTAAQPDAGVQFSTIDPISSITDFEADFEVVVDTNLAAADLPGCPT